MRARWFSALKEGFRSLRNRNYRLFFSARKMRGPIKPRAMLNFFTLTSIMPAWAELERLIRV